MSGARDARNAMHDLNLNMREAGRSLAAGLRTAKEGLYAFGRACKMGVRETAIASYNTFGETTYPLKYAAKPPGLSDLNWQQKAVLTFPIPLIPVTFLLSLSVIPLIGNSIQAVPRAFVGITNLAIADIPEKQIGQNLQDLTEGKTTGRLFCYYFFGLPGFALGGVAGLISAAVIGGLRIISNNFKSAGYAFASAANRGLTAEYQFSEAHTLKQDKRLGVWKVLGFPGFVLGGGLGLVVAAIASGARFIGNCLVNSFDTGARAFVSATKILMHEDEVKDWDARGLGQEDQRSKPHQYGYGAFGLVIGGGLGMIATLFVGMGRIISNNFKSAAYAFASSANIGLTPQQQFSEAQTLKQDKRHYFRQFIGLPGLVLGGGLGLMVAAIAIGVRFIGKCLINSFDTGARAFVSATKILMHEDEVKDWGARGLGQEDQRSKPHQYGYGAFGLVIGGGLGMIATLFVGMGRIISNNFKSAAYAFASSANIGLTPQQQFSEAHTLKQDKRHYFRQFLGLPGLILGGGLGLMVAAIASGARLIGNCLVNSFDTGVRAFVSATKILMHEDEAKTWTTKKLGEEDPRSKPHQYGYGAFGLVIGGGLGMIATLFVGMGRIISNNFKSAAYAFASGANIGLTPQQQLSEARTLKQDNRHYFRQFIGLPGLVLGGGLGLMVAAIASGARLIGNCLVNSFDTGVRAFVSATTILMHEDDVKNWGARGLGQEEQRSKPHQYGYGAFGLIIGGGLGMIATLFVGMGRIISNNFKSAAYAFASSANIGLKQQQQFSEVQTLKQDKRHYFRQFLGLPGLILGGGFGLMVAAIASGSRLIGNGIANSFDTGVRAFVSATKILMHEDEAKTWTTKKLGEEDPRSKSHQYGYGAFGLVIGGGLGMIATLFVGMGRIISNNFKSAAYAFASSANIGLTPQQQLSEAHTLKQDNRHYFRKFIGLPGLVLGGGFGLMVAAIASGARFIGKCLINSFDTGIRAFVSATKILMHEDEVKDWGARGLGQEDQRSKPHQYGYGAFGLVIGGGLGMIATLFVGMGRIISNNFKSAAYAFASSANIGLTQQFSEAHTLKQDNRHYFRKFIGLPGLVLGGGFGLMVAAIASGARFIGKCLINSFDTGARAFVSATKILMHEDEVKDWGARGLGQEDQRSKPHQYGYGAFGLVIGGGLGMIATLFVGMGRIISNNFKSAAYAFASSANIGLTPQQQFSEAQTLKQDNRHYFRKFIGLPGLVLGGGLGLMVAAIATGVRFIGNCLVNSFDTGARAFVSATKILMHKDEVNDWGAHGLGQEDQRSKPHQYGYGAFGLVIGGGLGMIATLFVGMGRIISNNFKSAGYAFASGANMGLTQEDQFREAQTLKQDNRHYFRKFLGLPGLVLGGGLGLIVAAIASGVRFIGNCLVNSFDTGVRAFVSATKILMHEDEIKNWGARGLGQEDPRSKSHQYGYGAFGLVIGGSLGMVATLFVGMGRLISQTFKSWRALSGSLINGAVNKPWFEGLGGDRRTNKEKMIGVAGYGLAMITTLPVTIATLLLRGSWHGVKEIGPIFCGILVSPLVFTVKVIAKCLKRLFGAQRFISGKGELEINDKKGIEQGFRNIYSALTAWGKLQPGQPVRKGDGQKSYASFFRKCFTFNGDTPTERTLDILWKHYKRFQKSQEEGSYGIEFFADNSPFFTAALNEAKSFYRDTEDSDCFAFGNPETRAKEGKMIEEEVERIANFVKEYITSRVHLTPENLYALEVEGEGHPSWRANFWGGNRAKSGMEYTPLMNPTSQPSAPHAEEFKQGEADHYQALPKHPPAFNPAFSRG